jgi:hypothetical protein
MIRRRIRRAVMALEVAALLVASLVVVKVSAAMAPRKARRK